MAINLRTNQELDERVEFLKSRLYLSETSEVIKYLITKTSDELGFIAKQEVINMDWLRQMAQIAATNKIRGERELSKHSILYPLKEALSAFEQAGGDMDFAEAAAAGAPFLEGDENMLPLRKMEAWHEAVKIFRGQMDKRGPSLLNKSREIKSAYYLFYLEASREPAVSVD